MASPKLFFQTAYLIGAAMFLVQGQQSTPNPHLGHDQTSISKPSRNLGRIYTKSVGIHTIDRIVVTDTLFGFQGHLA